MDSWQRGRSIAVAAVIAIAAGMVTAHVDAAPGNQPSPGTRDRFLPGPVDCDGIAHTQLGPSVSFECPAESNNWEECSKDATLDPTLLPRNYWHARSLFPECTSFFVRAVVWTCDGSNADGYISAHGNDNWAYTARLKPLPGVPGVSYVDLGCFDEYKWDNIYTVELHLYSGCLRRIDWGIGCCQNCTILPSGSLSSPEPETPPIADSAIMLE